MKSYVVVGLGRFGSEVARQLYNCGCEVLVVDLKSELVQQIAQDVTHAVVGDSRDKEDSQSRDRSQVSPHCRQILYCPSHQGSTYTHYYI